MEFLDFRDSYFRGDRVVNQFRNEFYQIVSWYERPPAVQEAKRMIFFEKESITQLIFLNTTKDIEKWF